MKKLTLKKIKKIKFFLHKMNAKMEEVYRKNRINFEFIEDEEKKSEIIKMNEEEKDIENKLLKENHQAQDTLGINKINFSGKQTVFHSIDLPKSSKPKMMLPISESVSITNKKNAINIIQFKNNKLSLNPQFLEIIKSRSNVGFISFI